MPVSSVGRLLGKKITEQRFSMFGRIAALSFGLFAMLLKDPDDVICDLLAFGARFRTPMQLFIKKSYLFGVFYANSDYRVR
ncbi:hypothetical protein [Paenibacillus sp. FSL R10-2734]|uniref:hypothetical protein n=1 Tax=Paenibacillus sp. FSL R10-2734 TaxID=2954691 RepID=UPI0030DA848A